MKTQIFNIEDFIFAVTRKLYFHVEVFKFTFIIINFVVGFLAKILCQCQNILISLRSKVHSIHMFIMNK